MESDDDGLVLQNLQREKEYPLILPHSNASALHDLVGNRCLRKIIP